MDIFWLGLEALPREIRATEWRSWVRALSDVGLLSRTWITRRYQRAESTILGFSDFLSFWDLFDGFDIAALSRCVRLDLRH